VITKKALGLLEEAANSGQPFFLGVAPVAPHSNVDLKAFVDDVTPMDKGIFSAPIPADRHKDLFKDIKVPRTENFNPDEPSGANWIRKLPKQTQEIIDYNDHFYRSRLRALQSVDELVESLVLRLEEYGILDNTYIVYTSDNGFHIGQHRLGPGKECGFDEDINIPLIIRGPKVPQNQTTEIVTTHTDLAPTIINIVGGQVPETAQFDGASIPLTEDGILEATKSRHEHVNVEYWGIALSEGETWPDRPSIFENNTYKALRIVSDSWNLYYSVWCTNEHELYDLEVSDYIEPWRCTQVEETNTLFKDRPWPVEEPPTPRRQSCAENNHQRLSSRQGCIEAGYVAFRPEILQGTDLHPSMAGPPPHRECGKPRRCFVPQVRYILSARADADRV
jgi:arylsulfatase A-like enzyme